MASKSNVNIIKQVQEVFPNYPAYWDAKGEEMPNDDELVEYWYAKIVDDWENFPNHPLSQYRKNGYSVNENGCQSWKPQDYSGGSSSRGEHWKSSLKWAIKDRIADYKSTNSSKNGFKQFDEITGFYRIEVLDEKITEERQNKLKEIAEKLTETPYGLIDPQTNEEAIIDNENGERIQYYFPNGVNDPNVVRYSVLQPAEDELVMTDTLLESQCYGFVLDKFFEMSSEQRENSKSGRTIFIEMMQRGTIDNLFQMYRSDTGFWTKRVNDIFNELSALDSDALELLKNDFQIEEPQYISNEGLETKTKTITYAKLIGSPLIVEDLNLSKWFLTNSPKCDGVKEGARYPKSKAGDYVVHITNKPVEVLCKSANRIWDWRSCENLNSGSYKFGCFDDVRRGNAVGILYDSEDFFKKIDDDGNITHDDELKLSALGRFMIRWGKGYDSSNNEIGIRFGVEGKAYGRNSRDSNSGNDGPTWRSTVGQGLVNVFTMLGLWDFSKVLTCYQYLGYADTNKEGNKIRYTTQVFRMGFETNENQELQIDYSNPDGFSFNQLRDIITETDSDRVLIAVCENPMIWMDRRIIARLMGRFWEIDSPEDRLQFVKMLFSHNHANYSWVMNELGVLSDYLVGVDDDELKGIYQNMILNPYNANQEVFELAFEGLKGLESVDTFEWAMLGILSNETSMAINGDRDFVLGNIPQQYLNELIDYMFSEWDEEVPSVESSSIYITYSCMLMGQRNLGQKNLDRLVDFMIKVYRDAKNNGITLGVKGVRNNRTQTLIEAGERNDKLYLNPLIYSLCYLPQNYNDVGWLNFLKNPTILRVNLDFNIRTPDNCVKILEFIRQEADKPLTARRLFNFLVITTENTEGLKVYFDYLMRVRSSPNVRRTKYAKAFLNPSQSYQRETPMFNSMANAISLRENKVPESAFGLIADIMVEDDDIPPSSTFIYPIDYSEAFNGYITNIKGKDIPSLTSTGFEKYRDFDLLPSAYCWGVISKYNEEWGGRFDEFYESGADLNKYVGNLNGFIQKLPNDPELFYAVEYMVLSSQLGGIFTPEGNKPYRSLEPQEFSDYDIQTKLSYGLPVIQNMIMSFTTNQYTPDEILERIIQEPKIDSVGYQRMIEYLSSGLEESVANFDSTIQTYKNNMAQNEGIKGRLLRWMWNNGDYAHEYLRENPNLVNARIFNEVAKQYPLKILKNQELPQRSYDRHTKKVIDELLKTMPVEVGHNFDSIANTYLNYMRNDNFFKAFSVAISNLTGGSTNEVQFIRAGRLRWNTGLPTAPDGATEYNASMTGSIPEYPQIFEGRPFMMFRSLSFLDEQGDEGISCRNYRFSPDRIYEAFKEKLIPTKTEEQTEEDWVEMAENLNRGLRVSSNAIIYEANYDTSSPKFRDDLPIHRDAYMLGIENVMNDVSGSWECFRLERDVISNSLWSGFSRQDKKSRFINNLKLMRDGTVMKFKFGEDSNGNYGPQIELIFDTTADDEVIDESTGTSLMEWKRTFIDNLPIIKEGLVRGHDQLFIIRNGVQNLEEMWGWNPVENRTFENFGFEDNNPNNKVYDSKGSASIFNYDAVYLVASINDQPYIEEAVEQDPIEDWRLSLSSDDLKLILTEYQKSKNFTVADKVNLSNKIVEYILQENTYLIGGANYVGRINQFRQMDSRLREKVNLYARSYDEDWFPHSKDITMEDWMFRVMLLMFYGSNMGGGNQRFQELRMYLFDTDDVKSEQFIDLFLKLSFGSEYTREQWFKELKQIFPQAYKMYKHICINKMLVNRDARTKEQAKERYNTYHNFENKNEGVYTVRSNYFMPIFIEIVYLGYIEYINSLSEIEASDLILGVVLKKIQFVDWASSGINTTSYIAELDNIRQQYFGLWLEATELIRTGDEA